MKNNRNLKRFSKNKRRITGAKKKRSINRKTKNRNRKTKNRNRKTLNMKGGMFDRVIYMNPDPDRLAFSMKLSIQMHEFAMYCHFKMTGDPNFSFYVQAINNMYGILIKTYGELAKNVSYTRGTTDSDIEKIESICDGVLPQPRSSEGTKIPFSEIYNKYSNTVPKLYACTQVERSFINDYGFQLLYKQDYAEAIHSFYETIRMFFCKIDFAEENNYIRKLKEAYEDKLGDKTWANYGSMGRSTGFQNEHVFDFLVEFINNEDDEDEIIKLAKNYVDLFSTEMGDVKNCGIPGMNLRERDNKGTYIIIKLKDPGSGFVYDNTEMVVHRCYFDETTPAQYHMGIMRNPSDMIKSKFEKLINPNKLEIINSSNSEDRFF